MGSEARYEVFDRRCFAIVLIEVLVHARPERIVANDEPEHANDLGAFLVDRGRVEVVDPGVGVGADRVSQRAPIFGELARTQSDDILDAAHRARTHVL